MKEHAAWPSPLLELPMPGSKHSPPALIRLLHVTSVDGPRSGFRVGGFPVWRDHEGACCHELMLFPPL